MFDGVSYKVAKSKQTVCELTYFILHNNHNVGLVINDDAVDNNYVLNCYQPTDLFVSKISFLRLCFNKSDKD